MGVAVAELFWNSGLWRLASCREGLGWQIHQLWSILALVALVFTYPPPPPRGRRYASVPVAACVSQRDCLCPKDQSSRFTLLIVASDGGGVDKQMDPIFAVPVHRIRCRGV